MAIKVSDIAKVSTTLAADPAPVLSGDLDTNNNSIVNTSGPVNIDGLDYPAADGLNGQVLTTDGSGTIGFTTFNTSLVDLTDTIISGSQATGEGLVWNGAAWIDAPVDYNNLINKPSIPVNSDFTLVALSDTGPTPVINGYLRWNASGDTVVYQTSIPSTDISGLATVATSGAYNDLTGKPTIPVNNDFSFVGLSDTSTTGIVGETYFKWNSGADEVIYVATVPVADVTGLAAVATSGSYNDLSSQPSIPVDIVDLVDVVISGVQTKQALIWSGLEWGNSFTDYTNITNTPDLSVYALISSLAAVATNGLFNSLVDIDVGGAATGESIIFNNVSGNWEPGLPSSTVALLGDIGNVDTSTVAPTDGQVIKWNQIQTKWLPADDLTSGGVGDTLGSLNDVTIGASADRNYLIYDFGSLLWRNLVPSYNDLTDTPVVPAVLDDLTDVDTTTVAPALNNVLAYDGSGWIPKEPVTVAQERIVYVMTSGDDTNGDGSRFSPYVSLEKALIAAKALAVADNELVGIRIAPGDYTENNPLIIDDRRITITADIVTSVNIQAANAGAVLRMSSQDVDTGPVLEGLNLFALDRTAGNHGIEFDGNGVFRLYAVTASGCDSGLGFSATVPTVKQTIFWNLSSASVCNYAVRTIHPLSEVFVADCEFTDMFITTLLADDGTITAKPAGIKNTATKAGGAKGIDVVAGSVFIGMAPIVDCDIAASVSGAGDVTVNSVDFINNDTDFNQASTLGTGAAVNSNFDLNKSTFTLLDKFQITSDIVQGGKNIYLIANQGKTVEIANGAIVVARSSETSPGYRFGSGDGSFNNDLNTGMYSPADNFIGFATAGAGRMTINQTGEVNITGVLKIQNVPLANVALVGTVDSLGDVSATNPDDKQILVFNNTLQVWEAVDDIIKADKVISATDGNFAGLDATGNLTDSGFKSSDFATAAQGALANTALQNGDNVSELVNDALYVADADIIDGGSY